MAREKEYKRTTVKPTNVSELEIGQMKDRQFMMNFDTVLGLAVDFARHSRHLIM